MFRIYKQKWHSEELISTLIMHAKIMVKMQIQIKVSFSILMMVLHIIRDPKSFFKNYQLISREQVC